MLFLLLSFFLRLEVNDIGARNWRLATGFRGAQIAGKDMPFMPVLIFTCPFVRSCVPAGARALGAAILEETAAAARSAGSFS